MVQAFTSNTSCMRSWIIVIVMISIVRYIVSFFSRGTDEKPQGLAFIELQYIDVIDAIIPVRTAGGVAVLAHPGQLDNFSALPELVDCGLQGIEAYHPHHDVKVVEHCISLPENMIWL